MVPSLQRVWWGCLSCWLSSPHKVPPRWPSYLRCPPRERKTPGSNHAWAEIFPGSSHTSDLKIGTPVATLPGAWRYRVSTGTGRPGVSILWLSEKEVWPATSVSAWQHVKLSEQIRPWDTLACCWDVKQPINQTNHTRSWDFFFFFLCGAEEGV